MKDRFFGMSSTKAATAALLCCVSALVIGCSSNQFLGPADSSPVLSAALQGKVHGGQNPITGASVQLWAVGTSGYGSAASQLGSSVSTDSNGNFSLGAYTCPTPGTLTYITASGGNPGAGANPNIMLAAALGACGNLSSGTFIFMDEVTTTAAAYALGQYFTPAVGGLSTADSFGAPSSTQAQTGIANAFATVNNLVCGVSNNLVCGNNATGNAVTSVNFSGNVSGAITAWSITSNVATFTAANSLVAGEMVTLSGFGTSTFFNGLTVTVLSSGLSGTQFEANFTHANGSATEAGTFSVGSVTGTPEYAKLYTVADILAACVNSGVSPNPTGTCATLFADVVPTGGATPTDTLQAAVYMSLNPTSNNANGSSANLGALYGLVTGTPPYVDVASQPTDWTIGIQYTAATTLNDPQSMAADASGNIWVINRNSTSSASLTELSPTGATLANVVTIGGQSISAIQPRNEAIDTNGNVWLDTTSSARVLEYNVATPASSISMSPGGGGSPYGIAIDGNNNVFYTHESSGASASVEEFLGGTLAATSEVEYGLYSPGGTNQQPEYAALDTSGNLWMTNGGSTAGLEQNIFQMSGYNGSTACTVFPCIATTTGDGTLTQTYTNMVSATGGVPTLSEPFGIAAGPGGVIWTANVTGNAVTYMTSPTSGTDYATASGSVNKPTYVAVDGVGNVWVTNNTSSPGSVSEIVGTGANIGTVLSPVSATPPLGFSHAGIASANGITIDPSGNVWVASSVAATGGVFEIVGAAAPTVTPISLALKNGAVGAKP